jgi:ribonuclease J
MGGEYFDFQKFAAYGEKGVLLLLSDSTNVEREGYTPSEREVGRNLEAIFKRSHGKIFVSTFSSNIPRIQQVADISRRAGRRLVLSGRSMINNAEVSSELGYLDLPKDTINENEPWQHLPPDQITFLTTGSQGEPLSALHRIALDDHKSIKIQPGDAVLLSSKFIPGNERAITNVINHLYRRGAEVHYESVSEIHVSGHAAQEELKAMLHLTRPKYFVPVHGEYRHLVRHIQLAEAVGIPKENCFLLEDGQVLELTSESARKLDPIAVGRVFVDGKGVGDVGDVVLRDRRHLSDGGMILAILAVNQHTGEIISGPDLVSRGFAIEDESQAYLERAKEVVLEALAALAPESRTIPAEVKEEMRKALRRYFKKTLDRRPVVLPFVMEV